VSRLWDLGRVLRLRPSLPLDTTGDGGFQRDSARLGQRNGVEGGDEVAVSLIAEGPSRDREFEPPHLIDLVGRGELTVEDVHVPVGDHLGPVAAIAVLGVPDEATQPAPQTGLLLHLA